MLQILAYILVIEALGRIAARLYGIAILVAARPFELLGRHTQTLDQYAVYLRQHLDLALGRLRRLHAAQFETELSQLQRQDHGHLTRIVALVCFGHCGLGHHAVLHYEVRHTSELPAVTYRMLE